MTQSFEFQELVGHVLADKYQLVEVVGVGGMGAVYRAEQLGLGRSVAVKVLLPERVATHLDLFRTEALAASRINHPHAVSIYDFGVTRDGGVPYLVMEFLRGATLAEVLADGPLPPARCAAIGGQVLSALAEAHACGVVHRDLKPGNIVLEPLRDGDDFAKLIDFGIARLAEHADGVGADTIAGTPEYMAPEQIDGGAITPATDLYAVGVLLYEMAVGTTPFCDTPDVDTMLQRQLTEQPVAPHVVDASCPITLSDLIMRALRKDAPLRPPSARHMRDELQLAVAGAGGRTCPACGDAVAREARFCAGCGHALTSRRAARPSVQPPLRRADAPPVSSNLHAAASRLTRLTLELARAPAGGLVGRRDELRRVRSFYLREDDVGALSIVGPPGIGKARLVMDAAQAPGLQVPTLLAGPDPSGAKSAWYPVLAMLEAVLELPPRPGERDLAAALARVGFPARDLPGLCELAGVPGPLRDADDDVRLREAEVAALRALVFAHRRWPGCVLVFTDVDRYDVPSIHLLGSLCARLDGAGTRVIATAAQHAPLPDVSATLELGALGPADLTALAKLRAPGLALPEPDDLHAYAGGNPEALDHLLHWIAAGHSPARAPRVLVDLIAARLTAMAPAERRVLQAIAVHGTRCSRAAVERTHGAFGPADARLLGELADSGLVLAHDGDLLLSSELLRDVVRSTTPADVARALHANAAAGMRADEPIHLGALHAAGARDPARGFDACVAAAGDAVRRFDDAGASTWLARAADLADTPARMIDASLRLTDVLRRLGRAELATEVLTQAALGEPDLRQRAAIMRQRARLALGAGDAEAAVRHLRSAIDHALRGGERGALLAEIYVQLAETLQQRGELAAAVDELTQAIQLVTYAEGFSAAGEIPMLWRMGELLAELHLAGEAPRDADDAATAALAYAERIGSPVAAARLSVTAARAAAKLGDRDRARALLRRAIDAAARAGDRRRAAELLLFDARIGGGDASRRLARELAGEIGWREGVAAAE